jgi:hypothetical protein
MSLSTAYKTLWLGGVWWMQVISWWGPKERSEARQENGVWKEEGNVSKIFEDATELDSWDNQERVKFICVQRRYVGRLAGSYWDGLGVLETESSTISSYAALGHILLWFVIQVFWVKIWAMRLVQGKAAIAKWSCVCWGAMMQGWGGKEVSTGGRDKEKAWDTQDLGTLPGSMRRGGQTLGARPLRLGHRHDRR